MKVIVKVFPNFRHVHFYPDPHCFSHFRSDCYKDNADFLLQKARCLNVSADYSAMAEESLSRALKLDPRLYEAWNILGEQYWKKEDLVKAKNYFEGALQKVEQSDR